MIKNEIIENYIKHVRNMSSLDDETLKTILRETTEKEPELLENIEKILYKKEKLVMVEPIKKEINEKDALLGIFEDIDNALPLEDITRELRILEYSNPGKIILDAIKEDILYIDDIEDDGTIYLALSEKGENLWKLYYLEKEQGEKQEKRENDEN